MHLIAPSLSDNIETPFVTWEDLFTTEEYKNIDAMVAELKTVGGTTQSTGNDEIDIRHSEVKWINGTQENWWLFNKISKITTLINDSFYKFNLSGMYEAIQHTTYKPDMHYGWHVDSGVSNKNNIVPRKLSITIQLSDPDSYEGGDLEIWTGGEPTKTIRKRGAIVAFPSFRLHRITPVTKGVRHSLVVWVGGPNFK